MNKCYDAFATSFQVDLVIKKRMAEHIDDVIGWVNMVVCWELKGTTLGFFLDFKGAFQVYVYNLCQY